MKTTLILSLLLFTTTVVSYSQQTSPLVGTWKMVSGKYTYKDSTTRYDLQAEDAMKIVTPTHFAVFSKKTSDGSLNHSGAGRVTMDSKNYTELITHSSVKELLNETAKFTYTLKGNRWHIVGGAGPYKFDEEWERVE